MLENTEGAIIKLTIQRNL